MKLSGTFHKLEVKILSQELSWTDLYFRNISLRPEDGLVWKKLWRLEGLSGGFQMASDEKCGSVVGENVKGEEWTRFSRRVIKGSLRPWLLYYGIEKMQGN